MLYVPLRERYGFTLDVCASAENAKCEAFFTKEQDGLLQNWSGVCWMNPPYGRDIGRWVAKAQLEAASGRATTVCLLPARTDTKWWHDIVEPHSAEVIFLRGRVRFVGAENGAPFPSVLVVFQGSRPNALTA